MSGEAIQASRLNPLPDWEYSDVYATQLIPQIVPKLAFKYSTWFYVIVMAKLKFSCQSGQLLSMEWRGHHLCNRQQNRLEWPRTSKKNLTSLQILCFSGISLHRQAWKMLRRCIVTCEIPLKHKAASIAVSWNCTHTMIQCNNYTVYGTSIGMRVPKDKFWWGSVQSSTRWLDARLHCKRICAAAWF